MCSIGKLGGTRSRSYYLSYYQLLVECIEGWGGGGGETWWNIIAKENFLLKAKSFRIYMYVILNFFKRHLYDHVGLNQNLARDIVTTWRFRIANMGLIATKPVFGVSDKARLKPVSSGTETSSNQSPQV